jgi:alkyldihydroxyacetonephosphate synthase
LEAQLRARNYTLGHFPQSFEYSTLGGWIATRSKGQQALLYGPIEELFAGGTVITPAGRLRLEPHPGSAAGPDLRQLVLGSEGRLGFITEATIRLSHVPEAEEFLGLFFPDFDSGQAAIREMVQARLTLSMLRLSTPVETRTTLILAGHERAIALLERYLKVRGASEGKALLLAGFSGTRRGVDAARREAMTIARKHQVVQVGKQFGNQWHCNRFRTPYLRNTLWDMGYAVDTLETAVPWHLVNTVLNNIESSLGKALLPSGERVHAFSHLSHIYTSGASVYVTYIFRLADDPRENLNRWRELKTAGSKAILRHGGTISHQHGIGIDHRQYLPEEKGPLGIELIRDLIRRADPRGVMNPATLIDTH